MAVYNGNDSSPAWSFVDGNGVTGISKDTTGGAFNPQLTVFNSKLYTTWQESAGKTSQIHMAVYNGNDSSPVWSFVDGNEVGIKKDASTLPTAPQLTVLNAKLYATWYEFYENAMTAQIRVAVYNGNDSSPVWSFVDGNGTNGINKDATKFALDPQLTVINSKLYATWYEFYKNTEPAQIRVVVYNGNDSSPAWLFVDGNGINGINKDAAKSAIEPQLTVFNSKLYSIWTEYVGSGIPLFQIRVAVGQ
jgi:hypothetical protein